MPKRTLAAAYFLVQGLAGLLWWAWLFLDPSADDHFWPRGTPDAVSGAFLLPDLLLFVGTSLLAALSVRVDARATVPLCWLTLGAVGYATLYCLALTALTGEAWPAAWAMTTSLAGTIVAVRWASA